MTDAMMNTKVDQIRLLEAQIKAIEKEAESLKDELKAELDRRNVDSVDTGLHKIFWKAFERFNVSSEKLREDGLYDKYAVKSVVTQFKVT